MFADINLRNFNADSAVFTLTSGFGINNENMHLNNTYPWYWGWALGRCDGSGLGVGLDAADIITRGANQFIAVPSGYSYYTDVSIKPSWYYELPTSTNPYGQYMLFHDFQFGTLIHSCMSPEEINYYIYSVLQIGNMFKPSGKSIINYLVFDATAFGLINGVDTWDMCHVLETTYAIWHTSNTPPDDF